MDWISVKDKLPELETDVLTIAPINNGDWNFRVGYINEYTVRVGGNWPQWVFNGEYGYTDPLYWMPLPSTPAIPKKS